MCDPNLTMRSEKEFFFSFLTMLLEVMDCECNIAAKERIERSIAIVSSCIQNFPDDPLPFLDEKNWAPIFDIIFHWNKIKGIRRSVMVWDQNFFPYSSLQVMNIDILLSKLSLVFRN